MTHPAMPEVRLFDWHAGKDKAGFLCGYWRDTDSAITVQQVIEYCLGVPCYVVTHRPSKRWKGESE